MDSNEVVRVTLTSANLSRRQGLMALFKVRTTSS
ncbi:hypothetical protein DFAR_340024 [Desulfarculales bacterium]